MKHKIPYIKELLVIVALFALSFGLSSWLIPSAPSRLKATNTPVVTNKELIHLLAVGDSLTEGVGDTTEAGGYVPLLKSGLMDSLNIQALETVNYGRSGDKTWQIQWRIEKNPKLQQALKEADAITLTVGGNDLMKVVKADMFNDITPESVKKKEVAYQKKLKELYQTLRKYNDRAPIYQLGIYNPYYMNFEELPSMQEIVNHWNLASKEIVKEEKKAFFIPINDLIYKGTEQKNRVETAESSESKKVNNLLSDTDNFHPNNLGYQVIANEFQKEMIETKKLWLEK